MGGRQVVARRSGDLALAGKPLLAAYCSVRGGHRLNSMVLQALFADAEAWTVVQSPRVRERAPVEMGFAVARKHAAKLRSLVQIGGLRLPAVLLVLATALPSIEALLVTVLATAGVAAGVLAERWLFFAEAKHVVTLYYGAERV